MFKFTAILLSFVSMPFAFDYYVNYHPDGQLRKGDVVEIGVRCPKCNREAGYIGGQPSKSAFECEKCNHKFYVENPGEDVEGSDVKTIPIP